MGERLDCHLCGKKQVSRVGLTYLNNFKRFWGIGAAPSCRNQGEGQGNSVTECNSSIKEVVGGEWYPWASLSVEGMLTGQSSLSLGTG